MKRRQLAVMCLSFTLLASGMSAAASADDDILINDFEAADYGDWKVEGEAFGTGPAKRHARRPDAGHRFRRQGTRQHVPRRRQADGQADLARVHHRAGLHQVPHRWRRTSGQDLHESARRRRSRPHRHGPQHPAGRQRVSQLGELGRQKVQGQESRSPDRRRRVRRLGPHQRRSDLAEQHASGEETRPSTAQACATKILIRRTPKRSRSRASTSSSPSRTRDNAAG